MSFALFHIDIKSFIARSSVDMALPDQDGVVRRTVPVGINVQGQGGSIDGAEVGVKHAFLELPGFWSHFGIDANYTYSPSDSGNKDLNGETVPFLDNSKVQANVALWYETDKFQARVALNRRSKRAAGLNQVWSTQGLTLYQSPTEYVDASVSYDINPMFTVYLQGLNLTDEYENYYFQWEDQPAYQQQYERRFILGVRGHF
jgi:TonB-dependent receptor